MASTIPELARRLGRHAVNAGLAAARMGEDEAMSKPLSADDPEFQDAEPFAPGTVSGGAIVAKTINNLIAGGARRQARTQLREQIRRAAELGDLERERLTQQIEGSRLQPYKDPKTGETYQLPANEIRRIVAAGLVAGARPQRAAAAPDMSVRLERARQALDARVERETEIDFQQRSAPLLATLRQSAIAGDLRALKVLGLPPSLAASLTGEQAMPDAIALVEKALERRAAAYRNEVMANVRGRYGAQYGALDKAMEHAGFGTEYDPFEDELLRMLDEEEAASAAE